MIIKILVVENEEAQRKLLRDAVEIFNKENENQISLDEANSLDEGLQRLRVNCYDGAVVDLRLEQNDIEGQGNEILKEIKDKLRFPVRVVSGHLGDLEPDLKADNYLFKCHNRGDEEYNVILTEFSEIFSTGITSILNNKGLIETNIGLIFWTHISAVLPELIKAKKAKPEMNIEKVLLRYISSHILEYLELSIDNNLEPFYNLEFYIKPPIKGKIFTGDIVKNLEDKSSWLVLTPACDLATDAKREQPKAAFVTLAQIQSFNEVTTGQNNGDVRKLKSNNFELKYHYLPETILFSGGFVNFQFLMSIPVEDVKQKYEVECVVTHAFRKDIISRFSNYYSRQGQPFFEN